MTEIQPVLGLLVAGAVGSASLPVILRLLEWGGVLDHPNARSAHVGPVPRGGGIGLVLAFLIGSEVIVRLPLFSLVAVILMTLLGGADDLHPLKPLLRLGVQLIAGLLAAASLWLYLGGGEAELWLMVASGAFLVFLVNAVNFMDGINGISGLFGAVAGGWFLLSGEAHSSSLLAVGGAALLGASLAFLPFNVPRARVFLGDSGSYGLGAITFVLIVLSIRVGVPWWLASAPVHLYASDVLVTLARRAWSRRPLLSAHRDHAYQRLLDRAGWAHLTVAATMALASVTEIGLLALSDRFGGPATRVALRVLAVLVLIAYLGVPSVVLKLNKPPRQA